MSLLRYPNTAYVLECSFETSRSSGKGGQHVNKTESRVTLVFDLAASQLFDSVEKQRIAQKLKSHCINEVIRISAESSRSQIQNKKETITRFFELLEKALFQNRKRIPTKVSKSQKEKRLKDKKARGEKKRFRKFDVE